MVRRVHEIMYLVGYSLGSPISVRGTYIRLRYTVLGAVQCSGGDEDTVIGKILVLGGNK